MSEPTISEKLARCISLDRLDADDNDASVPRWFVEEAIERIAEQDAQIAALQERVHLCAGYDALMRESETLQNVSAIVDEQAGAAGLWLMPQTATEVYLQHALRRLHAAVEGET